MKKIISFGEILWDVFPDGKVLGGAPLNSAYYCSSLGADAKIVGAVGRDANGMGALETMSARGLSTELVSANARPTGEAKVLLDSSGSATYEFLKDCAWDFIEYAPRAAEAAASADAFSFGTLAQRSQVSRNTLAKLLDACSASCLKVLDVNLRLDFYNREILDFSLSRADVAKMNEYELDEICKIFRYEGDSLMRAKFVFGAFNLKYLILTRGSEGYTVFEKGGMFMGKAKQVKIVDTVGAGDAFLAGFTMSLLGGGGAEEAAEKGSQLAAEVCSHRGAFCL